MKTILCFVAIFFISCKGLYYQLGEVYIHEPPMVEWKYKELQDVMMYGPSHYKFNKVLRVEKI